MEFDILEYYELLNASNINIIYSGPIWGEGVEGISTTIKKILEFDKLSLTASKSVFAVFIEQMNNMLMYSADKDLPAFGTEGETGVSRGVFVLGTQGKTYFLKCGNIIKNESVAFLKNRIDYLNTLDKEELKKYYKQQIRSENTNEDSKGAGIGLIEIARRSSSKIVYEFKPYGEGISFFTMHVTINGNTD